MWLWPFINVTKNSTVLEKYLHLRFSFWYKKCLNILKCVHVGWVKHISIHSLCPTDFNVLVFLERISDKNWFKLDWKSLDHQMSWWFHIWLNTSMDWSGFGLQGFSSGWRTMRSSFTIGQAWAFEGKRHSSGCHGKVWMTSFACFVQLHSSLNRKLFSLLLPPFAVLICRLFFFFLKPVPHSSYGRSSRSVPGSAPSNTTAELGFHLATEAMRGEERKNA